MSKQNKVRLKNRLEEGEEYSSLFKEALDGKNDGGGREKLRSFVARIERLEEEKKALQDDIKEIYMQAKGDGFNAEILKIIVKRRKEDIKKRREREALIDVYESAIDGRQLELFTQEEKTNNEDDETDFEKEAEDEEEDEDDDGYEDIED